MAARKNVGRKSAAKSDPKYDPTKVAKRTHTEYDDEFIANALVRLGLNGGNVRLTCRQLNVKQRTLLFWRDKQRPGPVRRVGIHAIASNKVRELADKLAVLAGKALDTSILKVGELDAYRAALVGGISVDKLLALANSAFLKAGAEETPLAELSQERLDEMERLLDAKVVEGEVVSSGTPAIPATSPTPVATQGPTSESDPGRIRVIGPEGGSPVPEGSFEGDEPNNDPDVFAGVVIRRRAGE